MLMGLIFRMADIPAFEVTCLLFIKEITIESTSKLAVDSREYTCCTEACSWLKFISSAKKRCCEEDCTVLTVINMLLKRAVAATRAIG